MTVSIIVITYKRRAELQESMEALLEEKTDFDELILVDNHSEDGTEEYGRALAETEPKVSFYSLDRNLGVAGGRNYAVQKAAGDVLIFLDDDAVFKQRGSIAAVKDYFSGDGEKKTGVLAFRVINFYTGEMRTEEMPFPDKKLDMTAERLTSTFIGAGHAIRRDVFECCGLYPDDYFYGVEELDLSFRVIDAGYDILYYPQVQVLHKQIPTGRVTNREKWIMSYRNRMLTAYKYLPKKYQVGLGILLFAKIAILSRGLGAPVEGLRRYRAKKSEQTRKEVKKETLSYLKKNYGRLWI
jgi:GT2 family glycosyltransferase